MRRQGSQVSMRVARAQRPLPFLSGCTEACVRLAMTPWSSKGGRQMPPTQGNRLSCRDQEGRRGSEEAVPGPSVFPSGEPGVSGDFWVSAQGLVPLRWGCALPSPNAPGKAPNHIHTTLRWGRAPGKPSRAGAFWAQTPVSPGESGLVSRWQGKELPSSQAHDASKQVLPWNGIQPYKKQLLHRTASAPTEPLGMECYKL